MYVYEIWSLNCVYMYCINVLNLSIYVYVLCRACVLLQHVCWHLIVVGISRHGDPPREASLTVHWWILTTFVKDIENLDTLSSMAPTKSSRPNTCKFKAVHSSLCIVKILSRHSGPDPDI